MAAKSTCECAACGGAGRIGDNQCFQCGGSGQCQYCNGTGQIGSGNKTDACPRCNKANGRASCIVAKQFRPATKLDGCGRHLENDRQVELRSSVGTSQAHRASCNLITKGAVAFCQIGAPSSAASALRWLVLLLAGCILFTGCGPTADFPLINANDAQQDSRLYGTWFNERKGTDGDDVLHIGADLSHQDDPKQQPGLMQLWSITDETKNMSDGKSTWQVYAAGPPIGLQFIPYRLGKSYIASLSNRPDLPIRIAHLLGSNQAELNELKAEVPSERFWFLKYEVDDDRLTCWRMDEEFLARAINEGRLKGTVKKGQLLLIFSLPKTVTITDSQENLRHFFEQNVDKGLFSTEAMVTFRRVHTR